MTVDDDPAPTIDDGMFIAPSYRRNNTTEPLSYKPIEGIVQDSSQGTATGTIFSQQIRVSFQIKDAPRVRP
jgi:hypothetical protein